MQTPKMKTIYVRLLDKNTMEAVMYNYIFGNDFVKAYVVYHLRLTLTFKINFYD